MHKTKLPLCDLYYISFGLYLIVSVLTLSVLGNMEFIQTADDVVKAICCSLILLKILLENSYSSKHFILLLVTCLLALIVLITTQTFVIARVVLMYAGAFNCEPKRIAKIYFKFNGIMICLLSLGALTGIIQNRLIYTNSGESRYSMGMAYPTGYAAIIFFLLATYIYLSNCSKYKGFLLSVMGGLYVFFVSFARTETIAFFLLALLLLVYKNIMNNRVVRTICISFFIICAIVSFVSVFLYILFPKQLGLLNQWLSERLSETAKVILTQPFTLFGHKFRMQGWGGLEAFDWEFGYYWIDSAYISYTMQYGIIVTALLVFFMTFLVKRLYSPKNERLILLLMFVALHGIIIGSIFETATNPLIAIAVAEYSQEKKSKKTPKIQYLDA